jgi:hypothetical protein
MTVAYDPRAEWAREDRELDALRRLVDRVAVPDGGFTVDPRTGADVTGGYAVSLHPEAGRVLAKVTPGALLEFVMTRSDLLTVPGNVFGAWRDPADGRVYLDVSTLVDDLDQALELARQHDQLAVYDFAAGRSVTSY